MSNTIHKYQLREFVESVSMPAGARILTAQMQDGRVTLWAQVDTGRPIVARHIRVFGTGFQLPEGLVYIATMQDGPYVWHAFEAERL